MVKSESTARDNLQSWLSVMRTGTQCWKCRTGTLSSLQDFYDASANVDCFAVRAADYLLNRGWTMQDNRPHCASCSR